MQLLILVSGAIEDVICNTSAIKIGMGISSSAVLQVLQVSNLEWMLQVPKRSISQILNVGKLKMHP